MYRHVQFGLLSLINWPFHFLNAFASRRFWFGRAVAHRSVFILNFTIRVYSRCPSILGHLLLVLQELLDLAGKRLRKNPRFIFLFLSWHLQSYIDKVVRVGLSKVTHWRKLFVAYSWKHVVLSYFSVLKSLLYLFLKQGKFVLHFRIYVSLLERQWLDTRATNFIAFCCKFGFRPASECVLCFCLSWSWKLECAFDLRRYFLGWPSYLER